MGSVLKCILGFLFRPLLKLFINTGYNNIFKFECTYKDVINDLIKYEKTKWKVIDKVLNCNEVDDAVLNKSISPEDVFNINKMYYKFDKSKIISFIVDGNDVAGKETFTKKLELLLGYSYLDKKENKMDLEVKRLSFPNYEESSIGEIIKQRLQKPRLTNYDRNYLTWLFILDRKNTIIKSLNKIYVNDIISTKDTLHVFVFDRFYFSNFIYSDIADKHIAMYILKKEIEMYSKVLDVKTSFIIARDNNDKESCELHDQMILTKDDKDLNETIAFQKMIGDKFRDPVFRKVLNDMKDKYNMSYRVLKPFDYELSKPSTIQKYFIKHVDKILNG